MPKLCYGALPIWQLWLAVPSSACPNYFHWCNGQAMLLVSSLPFEHSPMLSAPPAMLTSCSMFVSTKGAIDTQMGVCSVCNFVVSHCPYKLSLKGGKWHSVLNPSGTMNKKVFASVALVVLLACFFEAQGNGNMTAWFFDSTSQKKLFLSSGKFEETNRNVSDPDPVPATTILTETTVAHDCHTDADCPENCFCVYRAQRGRKVCRSLLGKAFKGMCNVWDWTHDEPPAGPLYCTWIRKPNKVLVGIFKLSLWFLSVQVKS